MLCGGKQPLDGVYRPDRFTFVDRCHTVSGTVDAVRQLAYGEVEVALTVDIEYEATVLNIRNVTDLGRDLAVRFICVSPAEAEAAQACGTYRNDLHMPKIGERMSVTGPFVTEKAEGWNAIHPARIVTTLTTPAPEVPLVVRQARDIWAQIRAQWPLVPPMVFAGSADTGPAAALYPDGLAHLILATGGAPEPHTVWHEAGHTLHAAALKNRGQLDYLFTPRDTVGIAYWQARGYPGAWSDRLQGEWRVLGYEAFAESFAAVNLDQPERTETYGAPLDKPAMIAFFKSLSAPQQ